ncbi:alpha/beta fold hydrolase [Pontibacillus marinus]|uniref:Alpha/beta hydrolase n=1 Tax=Pontibacillus marinus BH030004 = DSM 16465 TaxID=1385511 RepID=A0A0A5G974_9BACI|nr:alpha/beta hydrolase [Pontibacillus marinus]KGX87665.1 alpha/beta hydrolase [Pontibacillus marinus BH030004 = DSM 16465]
MKCKVDKGDVYYEVYGEGYPLLILHSMGADHRSMKSWIEPLCKEKNNIQRIYIDIPAHGKSSIDSSVKSSDDILSNILAFIGKIIGDNPLSILGHSYGGYLAQGILYHYAEQIKGICLIAPILHIKEKQLPPKEIFDKDSKLISELDLHVKKAFETLFTYQNELSLKRFLDEVQPGRLLANQSFLASDWREKGYFFSVDPLLDSPETYTFPSLFITGRNDFICGYEDHLFLMNKFQNSTFITLDRTGHMIHIEKREIVQTLLEDWFVTLV